MNVVHNMFCIRGSLAEITVSRAADFADVLGQFSWPAPSMSGAGERRGPAPRGTGDVEGVLREVL